MKPKFRANVILMLKCIAVFNIIAGMLLFAYFSENFLLALGTLLAGGICAAFDYAFAIIVEAAHYYISEREPQEEEEKEY